MADEVMATGSPSVIHPEGQFLAVCVDCIDLGDKVDSYQGGPEKLQRQVVIVFRTGETNPDTGDCIDIKREVALSMDEKANLRKMLESWRNKVYTPQQIEDGVPLHRMVGQPASLTIMHKPSSAGRLYAKLNTIGPAPKGAPAPTVPAYTRPAFWAETKAKYAEEAAKFRRSVGAPKASSAPADSGDDLPFN